MSGGNTAVLRLGLLLAFDVLIDTLQTVAANYNSQSDTVGVTKDTSRTLELVVDADPPEDHLAEAGYMAV